MFKAFLIHSCLFKIFYTNCNEVTLLFKQCKTGKIDAVSLLSYQRRKRNNMNSCRNDLMSKAEYLIESSKLSIGKTDEVLR